MNNSGPQLLRNRLSSIRVGSTFTREHVEKRLEALYHRPTTNEMWREIKYLESLKARKGWQ